MWVGCYLAYKQPREWVQTTNTKPPRHCQYCGTISASRSSLPFYWRQESAVRRLRVRSLQSSGNCEMRNCQREGTPRGACAQRQRGYSLRWADVDCFICRPAERSWQLVSSAGTIPRWPPHKPIVSIERRTMNYDEMKRYHIYITSIITWLKNPRNYRI